VTCSGNFQVRTVSENRAKASNSTRKDRIKAWITSKSRAVDRILAEEQDPLCADAMNRVLQESKSRLLLEKSLGGKQL